MSQQFKIFLGTSLPRFALVATLLIAFVTTDAMAGSPIVETIQPPGLRRGEQADFKLRGSSLSDAYALQTDHDGIEVVSVKADSSKLVTITLKTDASMQPGLYPIWLVSKTGISNMRYIGIGQMPVVTEVEPNNVAEVAQEIEADITLEGVITREDVDQFRIHLSAGQRLNLEVEGLRLHYTLNNRNIFDPSIAIYDEGGFEVAGSDDFPLWQQDGICQYTAAEDGDYFISIRESAFGGHNGANYRLHVGDFPRPTAIVPPGGPAGQTLSATAVGLGGQQREIQIDLPDDGTASHAFLESVDSTSSPSPNLVCVTPHPLIEEAEPNANFEQANDIVLPGVAWGVIEAADTDDEDYFAFECKKGKKYTANLTARSTLRSPLDAVMNLYGPDKKHIQGADDVAGRMDPSFEFTAAADGRHYVRVRDHLRHGSPLHLYWLEISESQKATTLSPKELRRSEAYQVMVPRGGHGVMVVSAVRKQHNDVIKPQAISLPEGVATQSFDIPKSRREIPLVFSAAADAELGASQLRLTDQTSPQRTRYEQTVKTVLGQNRRSLLSPVRDHNHVVVIESNPFEIEVVPPKSPIVRNGSKDLIMRIKRLNTSGDKPFASTVSLRTSYNPPGVGINNGRRFEKEIEEIRIPMTANSKAALGQWPLVFIARYASPGAGGGVEVATPPVMLEVQESWFDMKFVSQSTGEIGSDATVVVDVQASTELPADAEVELVGLPKGVTSTNGKLPVDQETRQVVFPLQIDESAKPGLNKNLICVARVHIDGDPVTQTLGGGRLRIDKPIAAKKVVSKTKAATPKPATKTLTRLEQLRMAADNANEGTQ